METAMESKSYTRYIELFLIIIAIILGILGTIAYYDVRHNSNEDQEMDELTVKSITVDGKGVFGNYTGMNYKLVTSFTETLGSNTLNSVVYSGAAGTTTLTLPTASYGTRCVIVFAEDVKGTDTLIINCRAGNNFDSKSYIPTITTNTIRYSKLGNSKSTLTYTPADAETNFLSIGSEIQFISGR